MAELTLEERGAYNTILDLIYARDGEVPDDERFVCSHLRCDIRVWRRIRASLIAKRKIHSVDGRLANGRCSKELLTFAKRGDKPPARTPNGSNLERTSAELPLEYQRTLRQKSNDINAPPNRTKNLELRKKTLSSIRGLDESEFSQFWTLYPRKEAKLSAKRAYAKARLTTDHEQIIAALRSQHRALLEKEPQFRPLPATWLNAGRYLDEKPVAAAARGGFIV